MRHRSRRDVIKQWPPVTIEKPCHLAMIKQQRLRYGPIPDMLLPVNDILHTKEQVQLEKIFQVDDKYRKVILIEGAPGSGKSILSWDICNRWGAGELFQEYEVVILLQLRDAKVQAATKLADLLPARDRSMAESVAEQIKACDGQKVLFILDGWDELPTHLQADSLFRDIIVSNGDNALCKSAVIVTSRPIASDKLHRIASSRVEIVGFTPQELTQYFTKCLNGDSRAVAILLERIEENPVVASSCYLPLNAAIVVHLFLSGNHTLPTTIHGIFNSLVLCCLAHYHRVRCRLEGKAANIDSLNNLPDSLHKCFKKLCKLAYWGVKNNRVTFPSDNLDALGIHHEELEIGLLQAVHSLVGHQESVYYNFLHLEIQELLAAYHISFMSSSEQISHFHEFFIQPRFAVVYQFYAGITQFQSERRYIRKLPSVIRNRLHIPTGVRDVITTMIQSGIKQRLVAVIRCLFEANAPSLCHFVAIQLNGKLDLSGTTMLPLDCLSLGYFLSCVCASTDNEFTVLLNHCSINDNCCKYLVRSLSRCPSCDTAPNEASRCASCTAAKHGQLNMKLSHNQINKEGASFLAKVLKICMVFRSLDLSRNAIGGLGLKSLADALITNSSLVQLKLVECSLSVTEDNSPVIQKALQFNYTLKELSFSQNQNVSDAGAVAIAQGLIHNFSLRILEMNQCGVRDAGLKSLSEFLTVNNSLQELQIVDNHFSECGLSVLTESLKMDTSLTTIWLSSCHEYLDIQFTVNHARSIHMYSFISVYFR